MTAFELNEDQGRAATTLAGPVLVTAGAGSGKTRVLTERAANAVGARPVAGWVPVDVGSVMAITYTEKAAGELGERIRGALREAGLQTQARSVDGAWISTIHGMCARILRTEALEAGIDPAFRVFDTVESGRIREQAFESAVRGMGEQRGPLRLLGAQDFSAVASTVFALSDDLNTRGASATDLDIEQPEDVRLLAVEAIEFFREKSVYFETCGLDSKAVDDHGGACAHTQQALATLIGEGLADDQLAEAVWRALASHVIPRSYKGVEEQKEDIEQTRELLCSRLSAVITHPLVEELTALVADYSQEFSALKRAAGGLDFSDLQIETRKLLRRPEILKRWRARFALAMVDEFQDTDELQLEIVEALAGDNLCTVGDEQQSIYRFRGADVDVYRAHREAMKERGARTATLRVNYRSHTDVLAFINRVFGDEVLFESNLVLLEHGRTEPDEPLVPAGAPRIEVAIAPLDGNKGAAAARRVLAETIAERISCLHHGSGVALGDVAVLVPAYTHAHTYADALTRAGIEAVVVGGSRFFEQPEIHALRSALKTVVNPQDETAVAALLASELCGLSDDGLLELRRCATEAHIGLWHARDAAQFSDDDASRIALLERAIGHAAATLGRVPLAETILRLVEDCGLDLRLLTTGMTGSQAYANVLKLSRMASAFELSAESGIANFLAYLDAKEEYRDHEAPAALASGDTSAVRIMSIHAAKGLEFPVVVVPELDATGRTDRHIARWERGGEWRISMALPSSWGGKTAALRQAPVYQMLDENERQADREERKRQFYVACTRARELLILAGSRVKKSTSDTMLNWLVDVLGIQIEPGCESDVPLSGASTVKVRVLPWPQSETSEEDSIEDPGSGRSGNDAWYSLLLRDVEPLKERADSPRRLSYSGISLYRSCALRFKAEKILGLGVTAEAAGPAVRRGSALHTLLQVAGEDGSLDQARLDAVARHYRLEPRDVRRVSDAFRAYRESTVAGEVRAVDLVLREAPFATWVGEESDGFVLDGTIDVYARTGDHALIVDYKSGEQERTDEALRTQFELQANCYALAAARDGARTVEAVFVRPEVVTDGQPQTIRFRFTSDQAEQFSQELGLLHGGMGKESWQHRSHWDDVACRDCPALPQMCPVKAQGRTTSHRSAH